MIGFNYFIDQQPVENLWHLIKLFSAYIAPLLTVTSIFSTIHLSEEVQQLLRFFFFQYIRLPNLKHTKTPYPTSYITKQTSQDMV